MFDWDNSQCLLCALNSVLCTTGTFSHTLSFLFLSTGCQKPNTQLVTPATCLANRGLVKLAMKRFHGAVEDLGGMLSATPKVSKYSKATTAVGGVDPRGKGVAAAAAAAVAGTTTLAGGALDCLDSELGRALAEGRLQHRAPREVISCA